ncbi:MAG: tail fiber domain-containing protein, partial [bacterium]|nr:tail fiber domain-containing protein [bacterium]
GIGTISPSTKLDVDGTIKIRSAQQLQFNNSDNTSGVSIQAENTTGVPGLTFNTYGSEKMQLDNSGRLLVGTSVSSSPVGFSHLVQVEGLTSTTSSLSLTRSGANSSGGTITLSSNRSTSVGGYDAAVNGDILGQILFNGANGTNRANFSARIRSVAEETFSTTTCASNLRFETCKSGDIAPTERLRIDSAGNVGIGTSSPGGPLEISKAGIDQILQVWRAQLGTNNRSLTLLGPVTDSTSDPFIFATGNSFQFRVDATDALKIHTNGNVGIGTINPATLLNLQKTVAASGTTETKIRLGLGNSYGAEVLSFIDQGVASGLKFNTINSNNIATRMTINGGSGNVGIGTTSPGAKLEVDGDIISERIRSYSPDETVRIKTARTTGDAFTIWKGATNINDGTKVTTISADGSATFSSTVTCTSLTETSDQRFKKNITDANPQLADVTALGGKLRNWDWNEEAPVEEKDIRFLGLIAQEVESICPGIIHTVPRTKDGDELTPEVVTPAVYETQQDEEGNDIQVEVTPEQITPATYEQVDDSYKTIKTSVLIMKLLGAVTELSAKVAALEAA